VVLSRDEVRRVLAAVRSPVYRVCLTTSYACGLQLLEGARLEVADIDSAATPRTRVDARDGDAPLGPALPTRFSAREPARRRLG